MQLSGNRWVDRTPDRDADESTRGRFEGLTMSLLMSCNEVEQQNMTEISDISVPGKCSSGPIKNTDFRQCGR
jgi:hypothetical protein